MKEIEEAIKSLKPNRPIYSVSINKDSVDRDIIDFCVVNPIDRSTPTEDPILDAVNQRYAEWLNKDERALKVEISPSSVYNNVIYPLVKLVYVRNSPLKEPKLSKIYRFIKNTAYNSRNNDITNVMVSLYKHLLKTIDDKNHFLDGKDGVNAKQFHHIMLKMTERFGK